MAASPRRRRGSTPTPPGDRCCRSRRDVPPSPSRPSGTAAPAADRSSTRTAGCHRDSVPPRSVDPRGRTGPPSRRPSSGRTRRRGPGRACATSGRRRCLSAQLASLSSTSAVSSDPSPQGRVRVRKARQIAAQQAPLLVLIRRARDLGHRRVFSSPFADDVQIRVPQARPALANETIRPSASLRRAAFVRMDDAQDRISVTRKIFEQRRVRARHAAVAMREHEHRQPLRRCTQAAHRSPHACARRRANRTRFALRQEAVRSPELPRVPSGGTERVFHDSTLPDTTPPPRPDAERQAMQTPPHASRLSHAMPWCRQHIGRSVPAA